MFLDERARRDDARDVASHELVRNRNFELIGERYDPSLRDEIGEILIECVIRNAGHRDALTAARFFRRKGDLQRGSDRRRVVAVRFVEISHARQQNGVRVTRLQPEVLFEERRIPRLAQPWNSTSGWGVRTPRS
jgi:hypothetical protein